MFRIAFMLSLCLLVAFTGVGLLISREWGWSEYASDELYLVYFEVTADFPYPYYLINTDGSGGQWGLRINEGSPTSLECSPDGRTLAFRSSPDHLYVLRQSGLLYEKDIPPYYNQLSVANDGIVVIWGFRDTLLVNADEIHTLMLSKSSETDSVSDVSVTSQGLILYRTHGYDENIYLASSRDSRILLSIPGFSNGQGRWLASEQLFVYDHYDGSNSFQRQLFDIYQRKEFRLAWNDIGSNILSPDGRKLAFTYSYEANQQVYLTSPFSSHYFEFNNPDGYYIPLTHNPNIDSIPVCFLTFRPQMLIDDTQ